MKIRTAILTIQRLQFATLIIMPQNRIASIKYRKRKRDKKDELQKQDAAAKNKLKMIAGGMDKKLPAAGGNQPSFSQQQQQQAPYQNQVTNLVQAAMNHQNNMSLLSASSAAATLGNQVSMPISNQEILAAASAAHSSQAAARALYNHQNAPLLAAAAASLLPNAANSASALSNMLSGPYATPNLMRACATLNDGGGAANNRTETKDGCTHAAPAMSSAANDSKNADVNQPSSTTTSHTQDRDGAARHVAAFRLAAAHSASLRDSTTVTSRPTIIVPNAATPVYLPTSSSCPPFAAAYHNVSSGPQVDSIVDEIERLQKFRMNGVLTEEEFQAAKKKLLGL